MTIGDEGDHECSADCFDCPGFSKILCCPIGAACWTIESVWVICRNICYHPEVERPAWFDDLEDAPEDLWPGQPGGRGHGRNHLNGAQHGRPDRQLAPRADGMSDEPPYGFDNLNRPFPPGTFSPGVFPQRAYPLGLFQPYLNDPRNPSHWNFYNGHSRNRNQPTNQSQAARNPYPGLAPVPAPPQAVPMTPEAIAHSPRSRARSDLAQAA